MPAPHRLPHLLVLGLVVVLGVSSFGCVEPTSTPPSASETPAQPLSSEEGGEAASPAAGEPVVAPLPTLDELLPRIVAVGEEGQIPDHLEVRFGRSVISAQRASVTDQTDVSIQPPVPGRWTFKDASTLIFTPQVGFRPRTSYLVTLRSVQSPDGQTAIKGARNYDHRFTTPALSLASLEVTRWDPSNGHAEFQLTFTGPVKIRRPNTALQWRVDGIPRRIPVRSTGRRNVWSARLDDRGLRPGSTLQVLVRPNDVLSVVDANMTASGGARVDLPKEKAVFIRGVAVVEGAGGFFLRVICHDEASQGRNIRFRDSVLRQRFHVSPRCVLDEESAKAKLRFEPKIDFRMSPTRGGFRVHAPFARGPVTITIDSGARSVDGGVTASRFRRTVTIPARRPKLEFVAQGRYLPTSAWGSLALRHQNVEQVNLLVRHVRPDNVVRWLSESGEGTSYQNSDLILNEKVSLTGEADVLTTSALAMSSYLADPPPGLVDVQVQDVKNYGVRATVRFAITDLNLLAKRALDGSVAVWVLTSHGHRPVSRAEVELVVNSGRRIATCTTDDDGGCRLTGLPEDAVDKTQPFAIVARRDDDLTFLRFDQVGLDTSGYDVHGVAPLGSQPYRAAVYSDRGVYRPGDTAHVVAIIRADDNRAPPTGMPIQSELYDPKRKVARRLSTKTNEAGMVTADFAFADYADTGRYQVNFKAGDRVLGTYAFSVEEFVPERMEVTASPSATDFGAQDEATVDVSARYLFGGSAAGSRVDIRCELKPTRFAPKQHVGYTFDVWQEGPDRSVALGQTSGTLDAEGAGKLACPPLTSRGRILETARLDAMVSVFESGSGRTTVTRTSAIVHPHLSYIGLKSDVQRVSQDKSFNVEGVIVDWNGERVESVDTVSIELLKVEREYGWVYDELEGRWTNRRHAHLVRTQQREVAVSGGRFSIELKTPESASSYVVRARYTEPAPADGSRGPEEVIGDLSLGGSWGYWWYYHGYYRGDATPRPVKPESLVVSAPKEARVGEAINVGVEVPYAGRVLWTVESSGVQKAEWVDVTPGPLEWSFEVDAFEPNVYVSALLLKDPHEESDESFLPSRAYGVTSVRILPEQYLQPVTIRAPDEIRSNQPLEIEVDLPDAERPTYVTVAAVDEGILSLTNFKTPDPASALFARQRLAVQTFETIGWNVSLPAGDLGRSTGGGGPAAPGRIQMVKPVAMWSKVLEVPDEGPLKVKFQVPQYRGKLRVMVVGAGPERLVSGSRSVLVRDPIVLQTTLPRFLVTGDEAHVPVFLTNLSGQAQKIAISFTSETIPLPGVVAPEGDAAAAVEVRGPAVRTLELAKDGQGTVIFRLKALATVGAARLKVEAKAGDLTVFETLEVPFTPNAPRTKVVRRIPLPVGEVDLKPYLQDWLPTTESSTFWITSNPYGVALDHLQYLVRYPYGCVEQTTSSTRPLLYLGGLIRNLNTQRFMDGSIENLVQQGIDRVLSMQTPSGGFSYWPGSSEPTHWGTAYATHMLIDAKRQGFDVPQGRIDEALAWMNRALTTSADPQELVDAKAYMHFVLALSGRGAKAEMLDLLNQVQTVGSPLRTRWRDPRYVAETEFLLRAGLHLAGDQRYEAELLAVDLTPIQTDRRNGWSFYSDRRRRGLMLSILVDLFGPRETLEPLAQLVSEDLEGRPSYYFTTQELAWGITGLGKMLGKVTDKFPPPTLTGNGRAIPPQVAPPTKDDLGDRTFSLYRASEYEKLVLTTRHQEDDRVFLVLSSVGVKKDTPWKTGGDGIRIERQFRDARGEVIDPQTPISLGDLIYVELTLRNTTPDTIQNVAVVDRFPAAWEIENPRLGRGARADWFDQSSRWYPAHMNLRDDRIEAFGALRPRRPLKLIYQLRAVSAGTFAVLPVEAEAMYDPARWARQSARPMTVRGPWDDELPAQ